MQPSEIASLRVHDLLQIDQDSLLLANVDAQGFLAMAAANGVGGIAPATMPSSVVAVPPLPFSRERQADRRCGADAAGLADFLIAEPPEIIPDIVPIVIPDITHGLISVITPRWRTRACCVSKVQSCP